MVVSVTYTICSGPKVDAYKLVSHPLIAKMILFVNISNNFSITFSIAHWAT